MTTESRMRHGARAAVGVAALLTLALSGCAGGTPADPSGSNEPSVAPSSPATTGDLVDGCEEGVAETDLFASAYDRPLARCDEGAPAAIPLAEKKKMTIIAVAGESAAPLFLAQAAGEFEAENLEVEIQAAQTSDIPALIAAGTADAAWGQALDVALYNSADQDLGIKIVMGQFAIPDGPDDQLQQGFWANSSHFADPANPTFAELNGTTIGMYAATPPPTYAAFAEKWVDAGLDPSTVSWQTVPFPDFPQALMNDAIAFGSVVNPFWGQFVDNDSMVFMGPMPSVTSSGTMFGERLLQDEPEVGRAFVRAIIRTINTYLPEDYKESRPDSVQTVADALGITVEALKSTPSTRFDWEIRGNSTADSQNGYRILGFYDREDNVAEDEVVDRGPVQAVLRGQ